MYLVEPNSLWWDADRIWHPFAETVANGGRPYADVWDNKPPLFHYINLLAYQSGYYGTVMFGLIGLCNGISAGLLYRYLDRLRGGPAAILGGVLFLSALPVTFGTIINVRSFAIVFVLLAVMLPVKAHWKRGVCLGLAGLFTQFAIVGAVVVGILSLREVSANSRVRWATGYALGGLIVVAAAYGSVYLFWGPVAFQKAIELSLTSFSGYAQNADAASILLSPLNWAKSLSHIVVRMLHVLIPASLFIIQWLSSKHRGTATRMVVLMAIALSLPLLFKSLYYYWVLPLPFLAAVAALGYDDLYHRYHSD